MALDDSKLRDMILLSLSGNKEVYEQFLLNIFPLVKSMVRKKVFNPNDREDVVQTILLNVHKSLQTYDAGRSALSWVMAIAHYKIVDYIRKYTKLKENELESPEGDLSIFAAANNNSLEAMEIIQSLPESLRIPIVLTKLEGRDTGEAAQIMGIKENALRTRVSRALKQIKKFLEDENFEKG